MSASQMPAERTRRGGAVIQEIGVVVERHAVAKGLRTFVVETDSGQFPARLAASCLLEPEVEDEVLLAVPARGGDLFVLAVLQRMSESPATVRFDAPGLELAVPNGTISMVAGDGIDMVAKERLSLVSERLSVQAREGALSIARLLVTSRDILARSDRAEGVFDSVETVAHRLTQRLDRAYRFVEELDVTRAAEIDSRASGRFVMRAKDAFINARRLFKVDGEQIHMG